jgi:tRNA dimethylallyltransferase
MPIPLIIGPTASGKSSLAVTLALILKRDLAPEILSADAFQVYRGMDIGTAKPTHSERQGIPHHLIDLIDPSQPFTVADWLAAANTALADIRSRGALPILVGGTHFYIQSFLFGLMETPDSDPALRKDLQCMDPRARRSELERIDPEAAARIHPNDDRRTIRALEVHRLTGQPISRLQQQWERPPRPDCFLVAIEWPVEELNRRINARVRDMLDRGLVNEVRALHPRLGHTARQALGYKQILKHLEGHSSLEDAVEAIKIETRRFAKNQRTWIRRLAANRTTLRIDAATHPPATWPGLVMQHMTILESPTT